MHRLVTGMTNSVVQFRSAKIMLLLERLLLIRRVGKLKEDVHTYFSEIIQAGQNKLP